MRSWLSRKRFRERVASGGVNIERLVLREEVPVKIDDEAVKSEEDGSMPSDSRLADSIVEKGEGNPVSLSEYLTAPTARFFTDDPAETITFDSTSLLSEVKPGVFYVPENQRLATVDGFLIWGDCLYMMKIETWPQTVPNLSGDAIANVRGYCETIRSSCMSVKRFVFVF